MSGYFFVFDGMDGSGKSTAIKTVANRLRSAGHQVLETREPGGNPLAERIRACMLADWSPKMPIETELLLVFAARAAHLEQTVTPALNSGQIVLCDRFVDSSYVYQGVLGGVDMAWLEQLEARVVKRPPDQCFIFDLEVDLAIQRMRQRGNEDRFDRQGREAIQALRDAYRQRLNASCRSLIDASRQPDEVADLLFENIGKLVR